MKKLLIFIIFLSFSMTSFADTSNLTRTITFKNYCPFQVWIAFTPSYIPGNNQGCNSNSDCLRGAPCISNQCVYPIPQPQGGTVGSAWSLDAYDANNPNSTTTQSKMQVTLQYSIPNPAAPDQVVYQYVANFGARTGCQSVKGSDGKSQLICQTGQCTTDENGGCIAGMANPATHAELTLNQAAVDFYDLSFVNGVNIPIGIAPDASPAPAEPYGQNPLFWCGNSGFKEARGNYYQNQPNSQNLLACNWQFTPPATPAYQGYDSSIFYTVVNYDSSSTSLCNTDANCPTGERCGFSIYDLTINPQGVPHCGTPIAYTIPANTCGSPYNQGSALAKQAFGCYSQPGAMDAFKMQAYAMCAMPPNAPAGITAPPTCYIGNNNQPDPECCGCIAWDKQLPLDNNSVCGVGDAVGGNPNFWQANLRDKVLWQAASCPAGYAYQFDDVHSTFVCTSVKNPTADNPNQLNYVVTFCPDGQQLFSNNYDFLSFFKQFL